jgi:hypothetical protein
MTRGTAYAEEMGGRASGPSVESSGLSTARARASFSGGRLMLIHICIRTRIYIGKIHPTSGKGVPFKREADPSIVAARLVASATSSGELSSKSSGDSRPLE